jgi:holo-ACP synthase CitX
MELQERLLEVLTAKDQRAAIQREMIQRWHGPLICLTLVSPGPVKDSPDRHSALFFAADRLAKTFVDHGINVLEQCSRTSAAGPEHYFAVHGEPRAIKNLCMEMEGTLSWGRLLDIDVIHENNGKIEAIHRESLGNATRRCLVCEKPAFECMAAKRHSAKEIASAFDALLLMAQRSGSAS